MNDKPKIEMKLIVNGWEMNPEEFPQNIKGAIMTDLLFCQAEFCSNKEAFLKLLDFSADDVLEKFDLKEKNGSIKSI